MFRGLPLFQRPRIQIATEILVCICLVGAMALYGLWRMDYLSPTTAHQIRMTDTTRTAYVAKNIAEGRGYKTNELPSFLIDFYDQKGMLHDDTWVNADRFPFTAYAIAALYLVTQSTSSEVGILGYNLITFIAFFVLLYWLARVVWNDKWPAMLAVGLALLHPLTYIYLYLKDADMMLLVTGVLLCLFRYFQRPERMTQVRAIVMGTVLAWLTLTRPNIGGGFVLCFSVIVLRRGLALRKDRGWLGALHDVAFNEGTVFLAIAIWVLPFVIHSMSTWGAPFFSANAMYQRPLGTRFAMDTDTWWKYSEPGRTLSLGTLWDLARGELISKFTSSWGVTVKVMISAFSLEIILGIGVLAWIGRRIRAATSATETAEPAIEPSERDRLRIIQHLGAIVGIVVLLNFLILPMYGYQNYGYRHYLSFFLVFFWVLGGQALLLIGRKIWPAAKEIQARVNAKVGLVLLVSVAAVFAWNFNRRGQYSNHLFVRTSDFLAIHWVGTVVVLAGLLWWRVFFKIRPFRRALVVVVVLVLVRYQPLLETKRLNLNWFPADTTVWNTLRERKGLVMSFAMQGEVNWVSDRRNFPAPEFAMHVYSFLFDHKLEIEDVYIESAQLMIGPWDGAFYYAAPGFESYARLEKYQGRLPGYQIAFHASSMKGYPKFKVKPRPKASTVYRLVDRDAVRAMGKSPTRLNLGSVDDVIYTAHGWGDYFHIDGKPVLAATDATHARYLEVDEKPWEDTSTTFFLDERRPTSVDLEIYATHATTLQFYWNLDLYYYNSTEERPHHQVGTYTVTTTGWQTIHLDIPQSVTRAGFNKLGFKVSNFKPLAVCPPMMAESACTLDRPPPVDPLVPDYEPLIVVRDPSTSGSTTMRASVFASTLDFHYDAPAPH